MPLKKRKNENFEKRKNAFLYHDFHFHFYCPFTFRNKSFHTFMPQYCELKKTVIATLFIVMLSSFHIYMCTVSMSHV